MPRHGSYECRRDCIGGDEHPDRAGWFRRDCPSCGAARKFWARPPDRVDDPALRHIWYCNSCKKKDGTLRAALLAEGISPECLGRYERGSAQTNPREPAPGADEAARLRASIAVILADEKIRALADLKLRIREAIEGPAPADWAGFIGFAARAGVQRSKRYEAARRWGRSATSG